MEYFFSDSKNEIRIFLFQKISFNLFNPFKLEPYYVTKKCTIN